MAVVTETLAQMVDAGYSEGTAVEFRIFNNDPRDGSEIVSTAVADHIFVKTTSPVSRDDGRSVGARVSQWERFTESDIAGLNAGDESACRPILKRLFDWMRDNRT